MRKTLKTAKSIIRCHNIKVVRILKMVNLWWYRIWVSLQLVQWSIGPSSTSASPRVVASSAIDEALAADGDAAAGLDADVRLSRLTFHSPDSSVSGLNKPNHCEVAQNVITELGEMIRKSVVIICKPLSMIFQSCAMMTCIRCISDVICNSSNVKWQKDDIALSICKARENGQCLTSVALSESICSCDSRYVCRTSI